MASDALLEVEINEVATQLDENSDYTAIENETIKTENESKNGLDGVQHRTLRVSLRTKQAGSDVIDNESHEQSSDIKNYESNYEIGQQSNSDKDIVVLQGIQDKPTEQQITTQTPEKDVIVVECSEISKNSNCECSIECNVPKSEPKSSKRQNVFKSIIDRLAQKDGGRLDHQTKTLCSVGDPQCSSSSPPQRPMSCPQKPALFPHASNSPELLFTNAASSLSSSACSSSSSALNLSFLFRGLPGYEDSGTSLNSEQWTSASLPSKIAHPTAKYHGSSPNCKIPVGAKDTLDRVRLHPKEGSLMDDAEIFNDKVEMLDCIIQSDPTEFLSGMTCDQPVVCLDLENEEAATPQETCRLGAIRGRYYKSLEYLRKVRVISFTLEKEREKLRVKRQCLHRTLHQLRFLYNVTRLRYMKGERLDRKTISSLWNLAKFEELTKEKQEEEEVDEEEENGEWHGIDKRLETGSNQGSTPRLSPEYFLNKQESGKYEIDVMQCDDDVTNTSFPVNYSLRDTDEMKHGGKYNVTQAQRPTIGDLSVSRCTNPVETDPLCFQVSKRHPQSLIADEITSRRYTNWPPYSAEDQLEEQKIDGIAKINRFPAHASTYNRSNRLDSGKPSEGYAPVNCLLAHSASNKLEANAGRTPAAAHEMKRDLTNFTYIYSS